MKKVTIISAFEKEEDNINLIKLLTSNGILVYNYFFFQHEEQIKIFSQKFINQENIRNSDIVLFLGNQESMTLDEFELVTFSAFIKKPILVAKSLDNDLERILNAINQ